MNAVCRKLFVFRAEAQSSLGKIVSTQCTPEAFIKWLSGNFEDASGEQLLARFAADQVIMCWPCNWEVLGKKQQLNIVS